MGCIFKSFFLVIILVILFPILLLLMLFGGAKVRSFTYKWGNGKHRYNSYEEQDDDDRGEYDATQRLNTPIDQSTVEYIDFEEVEDDDSDK